MKKYFVLVLLALFIFFALYFAPTQKRDFDVEKARIEVFKNIVHSVDLRQYNPIDPYYKENKDLIRNNMFETKDRQIITYSDGNYMVFVKGTNQGLNYNKNGKLQAVLFVHNLDFPKKSYLYKFPEGYIGYANYRISNTNYYVFTPDRKLYAHWIGNKCFDSKGNLLGHSSND